jgi:hypothetical protein
MKHILLILILCFSIISCKEKNSDGYIIDIVNVKKEKNNSVLYLIEVENNKKKIIDSGKLETNTFKFVGKVSHAGIRYLKFKDGTKALNFTLTNETIQIILNNQDISQSAIVGSSVYDLSNLYIRETYDLTLKSNEIAKLGQVYLESKNENKVDSLKVIFEKLKSERIEIDKRYIKNNPQNVFVTTLLGNLIFNRDISKDEGVEYFNLLKEDAKTSEAAVQIKSFLKK